MRASAPSAYPITYPLYRVVQPKRLNAITQRNTLVSRIDYQPLASADIVAPISESLGQRRCCRSFDLDRICSIAASFEDDVHFGPGVRSIERHRRLTRRRNQNAFHHHPLPRRARHGMPEHILQALETEPRVR